MFSDNIESVDLHPKESIEYELNVNKIPPNQTWAKAQTSKDVENGIAHVRKEIDRLENIVRRLQISMAVFGI